MLKVNKLTSRKTLIPLDHYALPFCTPPGGPEMDSDSLGEFLMGDRIQSSPYRLEMKKDAYCEQLCVSNLGRPQNAPNASLNKVAMAIRNKYSANWLVDDLPSTARVENGYGIKARLSHGIPTGFIADKAYIYNHVNIEIEYQPVESEPNMFHIVRFTVVPFSIRHDFFEPSVDAWEEGTSGRGVLPVATIRNPVGSCMKESTAHMSDKTLSKVVWPQEASGKVLFTYDVIWRENSRLTWADRWDTYFRMDDLVPAKIHWYAIANSLMVALVLTGMVVTILIRSLRRDINRYNKAASEDITVSLLTEQPKQEHLGWKLVHADVFRPPSSCRALLCVRCGTGAQLLCAGFFTALLAATGSVSQAVRGQVLVTFLLLYAFAGAVNGYVTARLYKTYEGGACDRIAYLASLLFPGIAFTFFFLVNVIAGHIESTLAVPCVPILCLLTLWLGISTPLVFAGVYRGFKQDPIEYPVSTSSIPRPVPDQRWFVSVPFTMLSGGVLSFGAGHVELYFIMGSMWFGTYYNTFGFLFSTCVVIMVTCIGVTIVCTYYQLCKEDYRWWWRSFTNSGAAGLYVMGYSIQYFQHFEADSAATYFLYFGYMALVSSALFLALGTVGVASGLWISKVMFTYGRDKEIWG
jgi:transmembrane 9 superfamily protein 2/4